MCFVSKKRGNEEGAITTQLRFESYRHYKTILDRNYIPDNLGFLQNFNPSFSHNRMLILTLGNRICKELSENIWFNWAIYETPVMEKGFHRSKLCIHDFNNNSFCLQVIHSAINSFVVFTNPSSETKNWGINKLLKSFHFSLIKDPDLIYNIN